MKFLHLKFLHLLGPLVILGSSSLSSAADVVPTNTIYWEDDPSSARSVENTERRSKMMQGASLEASSFSAQLVNTVSSPNKRSVSVLVNVAGLAMTDPQIARGEAMAGQGHIRYQVDNGPEIATIAPKLDFHRLASGAHTIKVMLVGNDHKLLGPQQTLKVLIP